MTPLAGWENFYVIVGSSAGALIGLQFVVITLISAVLLLAAVASAPWNGTTGPEILWGILGLVGIVYEVIIVRRIRNQPLYKPQLEDWLFHTILPPAAYLILAISASISRIHLAAALFTVGAIALLSSSASTMPGTP